VEKGSRGKLVSFAAKKSLPERQSKVHLHQPSPEIIDQKMTERRYQVKGARKIKSR
jgi:hypothetical protein